MADPKFLEDLGTQILAIFTTAAGKIGKDAMSSIKLEAKSFAHSVAIIAEGLAAGECTEIQAKRYFQMAKLASENVLYTIKGISQITAEKAINDAIKAIRTTANTVAGFEFF